MSYDSSKDAATCTYMYILNISPVEVKRIPGLFVDKNNLPDPENVFFNFRFSLVLHISRAGNLHFQLRLRPDLAITGTPELDLGIGTDKAGTKACDLLGFRLILDESLVQILPILDFHAEGGYFFHVAADAVYEAGPIKAICCWDRTMGGVDLAEGTFSLPLAVRSRKPGDRIRSGGKDKRIDELLSSWGIEGRYRELVPIVEDRDGIVAVLANSLEGSGYSQYKFRDYSGPLKGRSFVIRIKGAYF